MLIDGVWHVPSDNPGGDLIPFLAEEDLPCF
jgi:hypothetical protein